MKYLLLASLLLSLAACNVVPRIDVTPAYGSFEIDGDIGIADTGSAITQSFDDLGLDDEESGFAGRVDFNWLGFQVSATGLEADYSGEGTTTATISSDGESIGIGVDVETDLDLTYGNAALTFDIIPGDLIDIGLGAGVAALDVDLSVRELGTGITVEADDLLPIPMLVVRAAGRFWRMGVYGQVGYIEGEYGDFDGSLLDADIYTQVRLFGGSERFAGHFMLGYRYIDLDFDFDDGGNTAAADFQITGPYVGLTLSL